ncbi:uncharacterized protein [Equus caballus]|uniref:uncharacterized protein n=1 Tax=Equus caballus TaxID=9796 RepID=UPI0038B25DE8
MSNRRHFDIKRLKTPPQPGLHRASPLSACCSSPQLRPGSHAAPLVHSTQNHTWLLSLCPGLPPTARAHGADTFSLGPGAQEPVLRGTSLKEENPATLVPAHCPQRCPQLGVRRLHSLPHCIPSVQSSPGSFFLWSFLTLFAQSQPWSTCDEQAGAAGSGQAGAATRPCPQGPSQRQLSIHAVIMLNIKLGLWNPQSRQSEGWWCWMQEQQGKTAACQTPLRPDTAGERSLQVDPLGFWLCQGVHWVLVALTLAPGVALCILLTRPHRPGPAQPSSVPVWVPSSLRRTTALGSQPRLCISGPILDVQGTLQAPFHPQATGCWSEPADN